MEFGMSIIKAFALAGILLLLASTGLLCQKHTNIEPENTKAMVTNIGKVVSIDTSMTKGDISTTFSTNAEETGYYTCPMHPQIHLVKSGKCQICGMDLVLVKTASHEIKDTK